MYQSVWMLRVNVHGMLLQDRHPGPDLGSHECLQPV
ncbi:MAG: hypothetical protein JWP12_3355 [Bacteroidetes bacterium]|nr:hypothetical protein [Bacteroidota bacterium]